MHLFYHHPILNTYRVEVSGWDSSQSFFVEKSELEWSEATGKHITLTHSLRSKAMIFVRLLQPIAADRSCPIAYQAEYLATTPDGNHRFRLNQVYPRSEKENPPPR